MSSTISHAIKHRASPKDVFYTPVAVVKTQISHIEKKDNEVWFDPFFGQGVYYDNFPTDKKDWTEIAKQKDFFKYEGKVDVICSNPPYSMIDAVLKKSVEMKPRIISYLLLHGAMTPKRMEAMNNAGYGLVSIYTCKVFKWYGMAEAYTFELGKDNTAKIYYDRIVHRV